MRKYWVILASGARKRVENRNDAIERVKVGKAVDWQVEENGVCPECGHHVEREHTARCGDDTGVCQCGCRAYCNRMEYRWEEADRG